MLTVTIGCSCWIFPSIQVEASNDYDISAINNIDLGYITGIVSDTNTSTIELRYKDMDNGDVDFILLEDDEIIARSYLNRKNNEITEYSFSGNSNDVSTFKYKTDVSSIYSDYTEVADKAASTYVGKIKYRYYSQGSVAGTNSVKLYYSSVINSHSKYNLSETYKNLASLAALIAGALTLPGAIASSVAQAVLAYLGLSVSATFFFIPDYWVSASENKITWTTKCGTTKGSFNGSKYTIKHTTKNKTQTKYSGSYYAKSAYTNHNSQFATTVRQKTPVFWGSDGIVEVVSWG